MERSARRRRWPWAAGVLILVIAGVVLVWFQPQKLFIDERVEDPLPTDAAGSVSDAATPEATVPARTRSPGSTATPPTVDLARGEFISRDHSTSGSVRVLDGRNSTRYLRLEDLDTDNGPDLYLYLSTNPADGPEQAFDDDFVSLGRLQGNLGDQNYKLPVDLDLTAFASVVIWCDRFNAAFGAADLAPA